MTRTFRMLLAIGVLSTSLAIPAAVGAWESRGCPAGYWVNNTTWWHGYAPSDTIGAVFSSAPPPYAQQTLLAGLQLAGGGDLNGAREVLLRTAIAMLLNEYPDQVPGRIARVNEVLASVDAAVVLRVAARFDAFNNGGDCLISGATPTATPEGSQQGSTGTPPASASAASIARGGAGPAGGTLPDTSASMPSGQSPVLLPFSLLLLGSVIAWAKVTKRSGRRP